MWRAARELEEDLKRPLSFPDVPLHPRCSRNHRHASRRNGRGALQHCHRCLPATLGSVEPAAPEASEVWEAAVPSVPLLHNRGLAASTEVRGGSALFPAPDGEESLHLCPERQALI